MAPSSPQTPRKRPKTPPRTPGTPRRRKFPLSNRLQVIKPANLSFSQIKEKLVDKLKLSFAPDEWQLHLVSRIRQGYDSIFCAGTGQFQHALILNAVSHEMSRMSQFVTFRSFALLNDNNLSWMSEKCYEGSQH